jgi:hypothetical protein
MIIDTNLIGIRIQLTRWGRICRALGIGYPSMAATEKARIGRGGSFNGPSLPPDLEEIDHEVTIAPIEHKRVIIEVYTKTGTWREHALRLGFGKDLYYDSRKRAEVYLNSQLCKPNRNLHFMHADSLSA